MHNLPNRLDVLRSCNNIHSSIQNRPFNAKIKFRPGAAIPEE